MSICLRALVYTFSAFLSETYIHSTCALVSEILESMLQTVQKLTIINTHSTQYVHILHYVHIYTHNNMRKKVQQIIHRPDTQCHGCALDGIQW